MGSRVAQGKAENEAGGMAGYNQQRFLSQPNEADYFVRRCRRAILVWWLRSVKPKRRI
jgi:hypothetical protein